MRTAILALFCTMSAAVALADDLPRPAPPFTISRAGAPPIQLSQLKGKVVALAFINTGCPHCQNLTLTALIPLSKEFATKGVQFVEIAFNPTAAQEVPDFIQKFNPPFPVGWSTDTAVRTFLGYTANDGRLAYVPHMAFIDAKGMLRDDFPAADPFFKS